MRLASAYQFHATVAFGDAVGNDMLELQRLFWQRGVASDLFAQEVKPPLGPFVRPWHDLARLRADASALLLHMSMGNAVVSEVGALPLRKAVVHHNITPAHFFTGISDQLVEHSELGRRQLRALARQAELGIGDSEFDRKELEELGFARTAVVPILTDPRALDVEPDPGVAAELADERTSILVVGQILPHKAIHHVLEAFAEYRRGDPSARLYLVGPHGMSGPYLERIRGQIASLGLAEHVRLAGAVPVEQLAAYYRGATVLLSLSDHEGFNVPLVEAMRAGLPIVAHAAGATPETLGDAGILLERKSPSEVAAAIERAVGDRDVRRDLVERGRRRLEAFAAPRVAERLAAALALVGWELPEARARRISVVSSDQRCGIHDYALAVCDGLRANGHDVTFVGVRHLDNADLRRRVAGIARGEVVVFEHEHGIFRDVPFALALIDLARRGHELVASFHELEPEKFHHYRRLSAALHYRPRYRWYLEVLRVPWVALRIASWFVRFRTVVGIMGALPRRLIVHSPRSQQWLDVLSAEEAKRDLVPLALVPLEVPSLPRTPEERRALRRRLGLPEDGFVFVSPGFFFPRKRLVEVIAAVPDDATLLLAGTRSPRDAEYYDTVLEAARGRANVIVNSDYDAMGELVAASDAVVLYYEGIFQSAIATQAIWAGLPCIFSDIAGFRVYEGAGLVARSDDELRRRMAEIRDGATYERLRSAASVMRRLLAPERLAPRYLVGLE